MENTGSLKFRFVVTKDDLQESFLVTIKHFEMDANINFKEKILTLMKGSKNFAISLQKKKNNWFIVYPARDVIYFIEDIHGVEVKYRRIYEKDSPDPKYFKLSEIVKVEEI